MMYQNEILLPFMATESQIEQANITQQELAKLVIRTDQLPPTIRTIAGVDVGYEKDGDRLVAVVAVLEANDLSIIETTTYTGTISFPYIPGLFSFRELPPVLKALEQLKNIPDLIICDGQGIAHPHRLGLASHLGVVTGIPTIGCAKTKLLGNYVEPGNSKGEFSELVDQGEIIGSVLRTQDGIKPLFISVGHKISIATACKWILKVCKNYRLPEPIRTADQLTKVGIKSLKK